MFTEPVVTMHDPRDDEIERLRMELTKVGNNSYNPALVLAEQQAEIERLRAKLERAHAMWQDARIEIRRLQEYYEPDPDTQG